MFNIFKGNNADPFEVNSIQTIKNEVIPAYHKPHNDNGDSYSISNANMRHYNESTGIEQKSSWKSLCAKSLEIARIMNSYSIKMAKMLLSMLDKIQQFVPIDITEIPILSENGTKEPQDKQSKVTLY